MCDYFIDEYSDALGFDVTYQIALDAISVQEQTDDIGVAKLKGYVADVEVDQHTLLGVYIEAEYENCSIDLLPGLKVAAESNAESIANPWDELLRQLIAEAEKALRSSDAVENAISVYASNCR